MAVRPSLENAQQPFGPAIVRAFDVEVDARSSSRSGLSGDASRVRYERVLTRSTPVRSGRFELMRRTHGRGFRLTPSSCPFVSATCEASATCPPPTSRGTFRGRRRRSRACSETRKAGVRAAQGLTRSVSSSRRKEMLDATLEATWCCGACRRQQVSLRCLRSRPRRAAATPAPPTRSRTGLPGTRSRSSIVQRMAR